ncbi:chemotaxis-specific protein-glutamate methyltransferase CheB [Rubellicoccus peritrichatus]|uniref:protein-glutamate methylesterase n=1 Tax=Rubellicoccus peritrichatus TaxID=3080537 RepID=A0AAQ3QSI1_9BACT|nr:chemotaxis-specific protein-glutamate methyltransferase CheB [Puniceicoccus sp. CR14]WOO42488.1 chemotaxis-specific protein-glutamate methyltransferase CheB [Puniceicoccus sp. CR14]
MRIAIVNDLAIAREALSRALDEGGYETAWIAIDGNEAVTKAHKDRADLILMDLVMPNLDGAAATKQIMKSASCPILVVTASVGANSELVYEAMGNGALDATTTPHVGPDGIVHAETLLKKIEQIGLITGKLKGEQASWVTRAPFAGKCPTHPPFLAMGSSTGGPQALATILGALPADFPAVIGIVQHVDTEFAPGLAEWLDQRTELAVSIAQPKQHARPGHVYLAAGNEHLRVDSIGRFIYTEEPLTAINRPSIDILFKSLAYAYPRPGCAVLLTGMGRDGAEGLKAMRDSGWHTLAQDKASSIVYGMPKAAVQADAVIEVLPLKKIAKAIRSFFISIEEETA